MVAKGRTHEMAGCREAKIFEGQARARSRDLRRSEAGHAPASGTEGLHPACWSTCSFTAVKQLSEGGIRKSALLQRYSSRPASSLWTQVL